MYFGLFWIFLDLGDTGFRQATSVTWQPFIFSVFSYFAINKVRQAFINCLCFLFYSYYLFVKQRAVCVLLFFFMFFCFHNIYIWLCFYRHCIQPCRAMLLKKKNPRRCVLIIVNVLFIFIHIFLPYSIKLTSLLF